MNGGHRTHDYNPFFVQAVREHERLHQLVERIHQKLDACPRCDATAERVASVAQMIRGLRDELERHFQHEEAGGYLEEALTLMPQLATQATTLQRQHGEFLALADRMLADARRAESPDEVWGRLDADYRLFAKRLQAHEAAENALLQRAFNEDLGLET